MVLSKKDDGREASKNASRPVALTLVTPRGVATVANIPGEIYALVDGRFVPAGPGIERAA